MKVLWRSFSKNGYTAWFDPQTKELEPHCIKKQIVPHESTVEKLFKNGYTAWFDPQTKKLEPHCITKTNSTDLGTVHDFYEHFHVD